MTISRRLNPTTLSYIRRVELYLILVALLSGAIVAVADDIWTGLFIFLGGFLVPQPFLVYALWPVLFEE